ncbi:MAG: hypothetical protein AAF437_08565 [Pseudomonadota bacterium]
MLALQLSALFFLAVSVAFCFGPRLAVYGPRAASEMVREGQVQFVGGCLTSVLVLILAAPYLGAAVSSGGGAMSVVMMDVLTMQFSLV